jgi:Ssp1 endopeptidase immunity protein Rap1a
MRASISVAIAGLLCVSGGAIAQPRTYVDEDTSANSVFLGCKAFAEDRVTNARLVNLAGFCAGVVHALGYAGKILPPEYQSCVPPTSDARQLARVVVKYIEARPQRMHEDFRDLTMEAFHDAWPCKSDR